VTDDSAGTVVFHLTTPDPPAGISPADMAPHADAGLAAYRAVKKAAGTLGAGDSVVVLGAGGLGLAGGRAVTTGSRPG
jgi:D-arabinose 1-dehydrogenase-like Zn-dependent alcohol dehydrogenase